MSYNQLNYQALLDQRLASELINPAGEYLGNEVVYCIPDNNKPIKTMVNMLRATKSQDLAPALYPELGIISKYQQGLYNAPIFTKNLTLVVFQPKSEASKTLNTYMGDFRVIDNTTHCEELNDDYDYLTNPRISFNQALFILLGFNTALIPDYEICVSEQYVDKVMLGTEQAAMLKTFFGEERYKSTKEFLRYAINCNFLTEKLAKDKETGIPTHRYKIYKETLPKYFLSLSKPTSIRNMTVKSDEISDGEYSKKYKDKLKVGGGVMRNEIPKMLRTSWWKNQPDKVKKNSPEQHKNTRSTTVTKHKNT